MSKQGIGVGKCFVTLHSPQGVRISGSTVSRRRGGVGFKGIWWRKHGEGVGGSSELVQGQLSASKRSHSAGFISEKASGFQGLHPGSKVDSATGHVTLKKLEPWINDILPAITYLIRANTDLTCLLSGTAIKAVIAYVAEYMTKSGLKLHAIFDAIKTIFDTNTEVVNGPASTKDKGRTLLTKIVNLISTKLELGSPMISLYLLQNPDHYTSHIFVPFYWRTFVTEARRYWSPDNDTSTDKVLIVKKGNRYVAIASTHDYTFRPIEHEHFNLYEWVRRFKRQAKPKFKQNNTLSDEDLDDSELAENEKNTNQRKKHSGVLNFSDGHPLSSTHYPSCNRAWQKTVPNFIGGPLPRPDQGDQEYYHCTMLALFKPWRSGNDLKLPDQSWSNAFASTTFSEQDKLYIKNMNLRYECLDSRDDYRAQLLHEGNDSESAQGLPPHILNTLAALDDLLPSHIYDSDPTDANNDDSHSIVLFDPETGMKHGSRYIKAVREMNAMRDILFSCGWTTPVAGSGDPFQDIILPIQSLPIACRKPSEWEDTLKSMRNKILIERRAMQSSLSSSDHLRSSDLEYRPNVVEICDKSFFDRAGIDFGSLKQLTLEIIQDFSLNDEQERAFRLVCHHCSSACSDPLLMYIGGMGGTGKSQVIKALLQFFKAQNRAYAIVTSAPTGNAASLLGGSTYHFLLGINGRIEETPRSTMSEICSRLEGVEYLVLDEVSMVKCIEMYKISEQLAKIKNNSDAPFGKMSMVFAGDFAQLPPIGGESVSLYTQKSTSTTLDGQKKAIGKALWHQVINVVILRKNMRNAGLNQDDIKFRTALQNMRYKSCTDSDIRFLNSLVSSREPGKHFIGANPWRSAPIIVGENKQKDEINRLGCLRFAADTNQVLVRFYSEDTISVKKDTESENVATRKVKTSNITTINKDLQNILWDLPPSSHEYHAPPVLALCIGLPVIIRHNVATELHITKAQRGYVYLWHSSKGKFDHEILDVLFILLDEPPAPVHIEGLPPNVVPITRRSSKGYVHLPDDTKILVSRLQVDVLPGFAMTCHASQGQSLAWNAVALHTMDDHHAYYTALSRSRSSAGTVILQPFNASHITKGASGYLRQEFRELELLDDIMRLRYEGKLDSSVYGSTRKVLIESFLTWKGSLYVPPNVHPSIRWSNRDPYTQSHAPDIPWTILDKKKFDATLKLNNKCGKPIESAAPPISNSQKHSLSILPKSANKKRKTISPSSPDRSNSKSEPSAALGVASPSYAHTAGLQTPVQGSSGHSISPQNSSHPAALSPTGMSLTPTASPWRYNYMSPSTNHPTFSSIHGTMATPNPSPSVSVTTSSSLTQALFTPTGFPAASSSCYPMSTPFTSPTAISRQLLYPGYTANESPVCLKWSNNSCAYDALFLILRQIWLDIRLTLHQYPMLSTIVEGFRLNLLGEISLEQVRDAFRIAAVSHGFRWGSFTNGVDLTVLLLRLQHPCIQTILRCPLGHEQHRNVPHPQSSHFGPPGMQSDIQPLSTATWVNHIPRSSFNLCELCDQRRYREYSLLYPPPILSFNVEGLQSFNIDCHFGIDNGSHPIHYTLKGVSYFSSAYGHFISRFVDATGAVFAHDGLQNSGIPVRESDSFLDFNFQSALHGYSPSVLLYMMQTAD
ncbi:hypothetical protein D9757_009020 [Collybiopsis confluens]|uniref:ATP-dependent DNA helicase n=1 Tax=Collybiopsis confluens TaxID=2823264 RepID=A0A8H5HDS9_9AGAR|nr:hypothetical protein D9757_009020 [Collybiopsis confluens]